MSSPLPATGRSRSRIGVIVAIVLVLLLAVAGGAYAMMHSSSGKTAAAATPTPAAAAGSSAAKSDRLRGKVQSISGNTLVLKAKKVSTTVTLSGTTKYGNKKNPATRADIKPGVVVVVVGPTADPTRVLVPPPGGGKSASPSPTA